MEEIQKQDKLFKMQFKFQFEKKTYFEEKLKANTANPKKLWKTSKEIGLQNNTSPSSNIFLSQKERGFSKDFQKFYSSLTSNLADILPAAVNKFGLHSREVYYINVLHLQENKIYISDN